MLAKVIESMFLVSDLARAVMHYFRSLAQRIERSASAQVRFQGQTTSLPLLDVFLLLYASD